MFKMNEDENSISFSFSSEMRHADRVIQASDVYLKALGIAEASEFRLVLRELLINAVEHGNKKAVERLVKCDVTYLDEWQFRITVQDEGEGFDHRCLEMKLPDDPQENRRRGYALIHAFTDRLEFNEKGNCVTAYIGIPRQTSFSIRNENDFQIITPSGDITASITDNLRESLVDLLDRGYEYYRFDFVHVKDIDSVALSVMIIFAKMLAQKSTNRRPEIVNASSALADLFHMTRMDKMYEVKIEK
ncbi:MAG: hypothetical protein BWK80_28725 [Desulfobacteraceae bacterium IS3]|nr:MAG: hypothetical protein BWK80_28725 [Desulfobacteraceae bacterium IS3]